MWLTKQGGRAWNEQWLIHDPDRRPPCFWAAGRPGSKGKSSVQAAPLRLPGDWVTWVRIALVRWSICQGHGRPLQLTIAPGFSPYRAPAPTLLRGFQELTCLPPSPGAGLPASPLRGRITRPDVRVSLRTSPRPAPRPRASSSRGRRTSGGPATPPPHLRARSRSPRRLPHPIMSVAGLKKQFHKATQVGRVQVCGEGRGSPADGRPAPLSPPGPGRVPKGRYAAVPFRDSAPRPCSLTAASLLPLPAPSPLHLLHPALSPQLPVPGITVPGPRRPGFPPGFPGGRSPQGSSRALQGECRAGAWRRGGRLCKVALLRWPCGAVCPHCPEMSWLERCSWSRLRRCPRFALWALRPALRAFPNPSFPGLPRLPAWEAVAPSRSLHALTFSLENSLVKLIWGHDLISGVRGFQVSPRIWLPSHNSVVKNLKISRFILSQSFARCTRFSAWSE